MGWAPTLCVCPHTGRGCTHWPSTVAPPGGQRPPASTPHCAQLRGRWASIKGENGRDGSGASGWLVLISREKSFKFLLRPAPAWWEKQCWVIVFMAACVYHVCSLAWRPYNPGEATSSNLYPYVWLEFGGKWVLFQIQRGNRSGTPRLVYFWGHSPIWVQYLVFIWSNCMLMS